MIGNAMQNFEEMVWLGELIDYGIKNKKNEGKSMPTPPTKKTTITKKKEGDAHAIFTNQQSKGWASYASQSSYSTSHLLPIQPLSYKSTQIATPVQTNNSSNNRRNRSN